MEPVKSIASHRGDKLAYRILLALPLCDVIIDQLYNFFDLTFGTFSILQVWRGCILLALMGRLAMRGLPGSSTSTAVLCSALLLLVPAATTLYDAYTNNDTHFQAGATAALQCMLWLAIWLTALSLPVDANKSTTLLKSLIIATSVASLSILFAYVSEVSLQQAYLVHGVKASSAWFGSAKGIAGSVVTGIVLCAYFSSQQRRSIYTALLIIHVGAALATYSRSGMLAFVLSVIWLAIWAMLSGPPKLSEKVFQLTLVVGVVGSLFLFIAGSDSLENRWADLQSTERAGSGRLVLWEAAADHYLSADFRDKLLGGGITLVYKASGFAVGKNLHTHTDLLDALLMYGVVGFVGYCLAIGTLLAQAMHGASGRPEYAFAVAVLITCVTQSVLTGQMFIPATMGHYVIAVTSLSLLSQSRSANRRRLFANGAVSGLRALHS